MKAIANTMMNDIMNGCINSFFIDSLTIFVGKVTRGIQNPRYLFVIGKRLSRPNAFCVILIPGGD